MLDEPKWGVRRGSVTAMRILLRIEDQRVADGLEFEGSGEGGERKAGAQDRRS